MFICNINIIDSDGHKILNSKNEIINNTIEIKLHDSIWIGSEIINLKRTKIHDMSVIVMKSVVSGNFHEESIIAGVTAKVVKSNIRWER